MCFSLSISKSFFEVTSPLGDAVLKAMELFCPFSHLLLQEQELLLLSNNLQWRNLTEESVQAFVFVAKHEKKKNHRKKCIGETGIIIVWQRSIPRECPAQGEQAKTHLIFQCFQFSFLALNKVFCLSDDLEMLALVTFCKSNISLELLETESEDKNRTQKKWEYLRQWPTGGGHV